MTLDPLVRRARLGPARDGPPRGHRRLHPEAAPRAWWTPSGPPSRRWSRPTCSLHVVDASAEDLEEREDAVEAVLREIGAARRPAPAGPQQGRPDAARARPGPPATRRPGSVLVSARTGDGLPGAPAGAARAGSISCRARVRLRFAAGDARGIAAVYAAGRVLAHEVAGRRGAPHRRDPGAPARALPGAPALRRRGRRPRGGGVRLAPAPARARPRRALRRRPTSCSRPPGRASSTPDEARQIEKAWRDVLAGEVPGRGEGLPEAGRPQARTWCPPRPAWPTRGCKLGRLPEAAARLRTASWRRGPTTCPRSWGRASAAQRQQRSGGGPRASTGAPWPSQPGDPALRKRLAEVKLQVTEKRVAEAHAALEAGDTGRGRGALSRRPSTRRPRWRACAWSWPTSWRDGRRRARPPTCSRPIPPGDRAGPAPPGRAAHRP